MFPSPTCLIVNTAAYDQIEFTDVKILLFILPVLCSNINTISKSMILHNIHVDFFESTVLALYLFITHLCFFFIFHQFVRKPFKFINNVVQTNESLVNELDFPVFSLFPNNFCININVNVYQYFTGIWFEKIRLKYNSFDTDMGIQMMQNKKPKAK